VTPAVPVEPARGIAAFCAFDPEKDKELSEYLRVNPEELSQYLRVQKGDVLKEYHPDAGEGWSFVERCNGKGKKWGWVPREFLVSSPLAPND
jgi:hypothetical protein